MVIYVPSCDMNAELTFGVGDLVGLCEGEEVIVAKGLLEPEMTGKAEGRLEG
jgi:hypothetical protein